MQPNKTIPAQNQSYTRNASAIKKTATLTITIPAGAAGSVVDFDIPVRPIASNTGADIGGVGNTSVVLGSSATFDTLVNPKEDALLANGEYYINHLTGEGRGKKKDSGTSVSATIGYFASLISIPERLRGEDDNRDVLHTTSGDTSVRISTATTTVCRNTGGSLEGIIIEVALTGTATFYNHPSSATGTPFLILPIGTAAGPIDCYGLVASDGIVCVTSAADRLVVVPSR